MRHITVHKKQTGLAMIVALLVLIALTLIVLSGSRNTTMQLRMSSNLQSRVEALETAQATLDYGFNYGKDELKISSTTLCTTSYPDNSCTIRTLTLPSPLGSSSHLLITNVGSGSEIGTSISLGKSTYFRVESIFDDTANGQGRVKLVSGMLKRELTSQ